MTNYTLERDITNDGNWEHYADLGCDEITAIEMWHYWQEKQPNYKFRMYKVTKELVAMSGKTKVSEIIPDGGRHDS
jgi:hypothetical protein